MLLKETHAQGPIVEIGTTPTPFIPSAGKGNMEQ
jgi:hypothetical protein